MKKTLLSVALLAALGAVSIPAMAYTWEDYALPYVYTESALMGGPTPSFSESADLMDGEYKETLGITGFTPTSTFHPGSGTSPGYYEGFGTFNTLAYFKVGAFWINDGAGNAIGPLDSYMAVPNVAGGYSLYALFQSSGTFVVDSAGTTSFTGATAGVLELWLDANKNTINSLAVPNVVAPGDTVAQITRTNLTDDILLGRATNLIEAGGNHSLGSSADGDFEVVFDDFALTTGDQNASLAGIQNGGQYFTSPSTDFYTTIDINGNFQSFTQVIGTGSQVISGHAGSFFLNLPNKVPEPATLGLLGIGLAGMGLTFRRRRA